MKLIDVVQRLKLVNDYDQCKRAMNDAIVEIERLRALVPVGYKLVPIEPTDEMIRLALEDYDLLDSEESTFKRSLKKSYKAMINASPVIGKLEEKT